MTIQDFLTRVIEDGIVAARADYGNRSGANAPAMLKGSIAGFEACRGKSPEELRALMKKANREAHSPEVYDGPIDIYWEKVCFAREVEWVCNCLSAFLLIIGEQPLMTTTVRGVVNMSRILADSDLRLARD